MATDTSTTSDTPPGRGPGLPVRVLAWGVTGADVEHAVDKALCGPGRMEWDADGRISRSRESECPFNPEDPKALAGDIGYHWAYVVRRADGASVGPEGAAA